jgi:hypothetical protein
LGVHRCRGRVANRRHDIIAKSSEASSRSLSLEGPSPLGI